MQTQMRSLASRGARSRVVATALTLLAALALVVQGLAVPAAADVNPQIEVTNLSLTKVDSAETPQKGPLFVGGLALLKFEWDASKTTPKEGDSFTITLPEELKFHSTLSTDMKYQGQKVGECTIDGKTVTCTFDERITPLVAAGNKDIRGTGKFQLAVVSHTTAEELPFTVSGDKTVEVVDLPGEGGIPKPSGATYRPETLLYKNYNGNMKEGDWQAKWYFNFGTEKLGPALGVTFDGVTERTITFNDTLGAGMTCPLAYAFLSSKASKAEPSAATVRLDEGLDEAPTTTVRGTFKLTAECGQMRPDGTTPITFVATGPFSADANFTVDYGARFVGGADGVSGTALPGTEYTNTVTVEGTQITESKTTLFVKAGSVQVTMRQGEGNFSVTKRIASDYAQQVDEHVAFTVAFDYALPEGTTAASFPSWTPPVNADQSSTLNADGRTGTATMEVKRGEEVSFGTPFPVGTTISNLREDTSSASPALPAGYIWKDPGFTIDGKPATSLTIADQQTTKVQLLNTVAAADNGFQVVKTASGAPGADVRSYSFTYTCTLPDQTQKTGKVENVLGDSVPVASPETFPVGTTCLVTEDTAGAVIDGHSLDPAGHDAQTVTIGLVSAPTVAASFTNTYTRDVGRFSVTKTVAAEAGDKTPSSYTFDYTCTAAGKDDLTGSIVVGKGETKQSDEIPVGYTCTVAERVAAGQAGTAFVEGYTLDVVTSPGVTITKGPVPDIAVTNTYTLNTGHFSVKKVVEGAVFAGAGNTFTVGYECTNPSVALTGEQKAGSLTLTGNGDAVAGPTLPYGTSCTVKEDSDSAQRAGYALATAYSAGQVTVGTATPSPEVTVTNTYTPLKGGFVISKTVDGDGAGLAKDTLFTFDYTCTPVSGAAQVKGTVVLKGGENHVVSDVPVGSCSVTERDATIDGASLSTVLTVDGSSAGVTDGTAVFNVSDGATVKVGATNTYTRDRGSFSVAKTVVGGQESFAQDTFVFDYVCTDGTEGRLDVPGDGTVVEGPRVPTGTQCTVTERAETAGREGYTVVSGLSDDGKVTIADKDTVVALTATNTYTPTPSPTPSRPGRPLARTGASNVLVLGVLGSVLVAAGGVVVALRRRREQA